MSVVSRFAPSPTGLMHFGNLRTAIFNFLYAKNKNGKFLLRIEDTDEERSKKEFTEYLLRDLEKINIKWDIGPEYQSERKDVYDSYYKKLEDEKIAYPCFCSEEKLKMIKKAQIASGQPPRYPGTCRNLSEEEIATKLEEGLKPALRFKVDRDAVIEFEDSVKGHQKFLGVDIGDFIIRRSNGATSFMFSNAIDDSEMGVTHALRGDDHLTNSPRQILILLALGLKQPIYGHFPMIIGADGAKLSKRNGSCSVDELFNLGYHPLALLNYLSRLGHSYESNDLLSQEKLEEFFDLEKVSSSPSRYDIHQLQHWQKEVMLKLSDEEFWQFVKPFVKTNVPEEKLNKFIDAIKDNVLLATDAEHWAKIWFTNFSDLREECKNVLNEAGVDFLTTIKKAKNYSDYKLFLNEIKESTGLAGKKLFQPLRVVLTESLQGPELTKVFDLLGKEQILERVDKLGK